MIKILETIYGRPWALLPAKLEAIAAFIDSRVNTDKIDFPDPEAKQGKSGNRAGDAYQVLDGVAVLPVYGILDKRANLLSQFSGGTSTELLSRDFRAALTDPQVKAILLDIESPGGSIDGTKTLADEIFAARGGKPVVAFANDLMASAAYWIGSAAIQVVATATSQVGSIGVAMAHQDLSGRDAQRGVKRTIISSGKYKRIASDAGPLSSEGQDYLQQICDTFYGLFLEGVGRNRGQDAAMVHQEMADGRIFIGAQALTAGLVDRLGTFETALTLARAMGAQGAGAVNSSPAAYTSPLTPLGALERKAQAEWDGDSNLRREFSGFGAFLAYRKAEAMGQLNLIVGRTFKNDSIPVGAGPGASPGALAATARAEWDKSPDIRREFSEFSTFLAFKKAEAAGLCRY